MVSGTEPFPNCQDPGRRSGSAVRIRPAAAGLRAPALVRSHQHTQRMVVVLDPILEAKMPAVDAPSQLLDVSGVGPLVQVV